MNEIVVDATCRYAWHAASVLCLFDAATSWRPSWLFTADDTPAVWSLNGVPQLPEGCKGIPITV